MSGSKLLVIKDTGSNLSAGVGDVLGIFVSTHSFGIGDLNGNEVVEIEGYTPAQLKEKVGKIERNKAIKLPEGDKWYINTDAEERKVWKDTDGKWYFLDEMPYRVFSVKDLTKQDIEDLAAKTSQTLKKDAILMKIIHKVKDDQRNLVECTDLVGK